MTLLYVPSRDFARALMADIEEPRPVDQFLRPGRRDFSRVVYSPSFRRLQGKTQLFPTSENHPFYRNRLSHSLEVSNISATLAAYLTKSTPKLVELDWRIDQDIAALAALAHDLGHPPFGHTGEKALDGVMADFGGFEGNAQTLRIVSKVEDRISLFHEHNSLLSSADYRSHNRGLNLTFRSLASVIKYDKLTGALPSGELSNVSPSKGYYEEEKELVDMVRDHVIRQKYGVTEAPRLYTLECQIMDIADDIAYSTFDLEDCLCADFLHPMDFLSGLENEGIERIADEVQKGLAKRGVVETIDGEIVVACILGIFEDLFLHSGSSAPSNSTEVAILSAISYAAGSDVQSVNRLRRNFSMRRIENLMSTLKVKVNEQEPALSEIQFDIEALLEIECLKAMNYELVINSQQLKAAEYSGVRTVETIFENVMNDPKLLPRDFREQLEFEKNQSGFSEDRRQARVVCDFIAGMTDKYAAQFYSQITGQDYASILALKPYA